tara:strand:+ start:545 stop:859 length:315 start_codon:yes stop_codon:yes gene_type:complete
MIIGTKDNCITIVRNKNDDDTMLVLALKADHIMSMFPDCDMFVHPYGELRYRAFIDKYEVTNALSKSILNIEYNDFKHFEDDKLMSAYYALSRECYVQYIDERV